MPTKHTLALSGLLALLAALALAAPAHAAGTKLVCTVDGDAKLQDDDGGGMRLVGGHGNYTFKQSGVTCVGAEKGAPVIITADIVSRGYYAAAICGSVKAISQWGQGNNTIVRLQKTGGDPSKDLAYYQAKLNDMKYAADMETLAGEFYWHNDPLGPKPESTTKPPTYPKLGVDGKNAWSSSDKEYIYAGELLLSLLGSLAKPAMLPQPLGYCTDVVHITGVIDIDF